MSLLVAPNTLETGTLLERAKGVLPIPVGAVLESLKHVTAGESKEVGVHLGESLGNVDTKTILAVLICRGEQADEVEIEGSALGALGVESDGKCIVRVGGVLLRSELEGVLNPLLSLSL